MATKTLSGRFLTKCQNFFDKMSHLYGHFGFPVNMEQTRQDGDRFCHYWCRVLSPNEIRHLSGLLVSALPFFVSFGWPPEGEMDGTALEYYKRHERHGAAMGNEMSDATIAERARMARVAHELREQGYRESLAKKAAASKPKMTREERERLFQEAYREFHQELRRQIEAGER